MANRSKAKGTDGENIMLQVIKQKYPKAERTSPGNPKDFVGTGDDAISAKAVERLALSGWINQIEGYAKQAGYDRWWVFIKRKGTRDPLRQYVLTTAEVWLKT